MISNNTWNDTKFPRSLQSTLKGWNGTVEATGESKEFRCPYGDEGDVLWVRETWCDYNDGYGKEHEHLKSPTPRILYKEDFRDMLSDKVGIWKPSIFMPKHACRFFLRINDVRVERLQDISEEDAAAEGVFIHPVYPSPRMEFASLWDKINSQNNWNSNPYVWVISFELTERPQGFC